MAAKQRVTLSTIAEKVGISCAAVSMLLSGQDASFSTETKERVFLAANELGYVPRKKVKPRSTLRTIGYFVHESTVNNEDRFHARYDSMLEASKRHDFHVITLQLVDNPDLPDCVLRREIDGVIVDLTCTAEWAINLQRYVPGVLINRELETVSIDSVAANPFSGIYQGVARLHALGHRRIALFGLSPRVFHNAQRIAAYRKSMALLNLPVREDYVPSREATEREGYHEIDLCIVESVARWSAQDALPTAIMTLGDVLAFRLLKVLPTLGLSIPDDISVIGFDNVYFCENSFPTLSSIALPHREMGQLACDLLCERIEDNTRLTTHASMETCLVERESIGPVSATPMSSVAREVVERVRKNY